MLAAPIQIHEQQRLAALESYQLFGTAPEATYDQITELLTAICQTTGGSLTLVGADQNWLKSTVNVDQHCGERLTSLCGHALYANDLFVIEDTSVDPRFCDNPYVINGLRFYAGAPIYSDDGYPIGVLCAFDPEPKQLSVAQRQALKVLARQVMAQMELKRSHQMLEAQSIQLTEYTARLERKNKMLEQLNANKDRFFSIIAHDLKAPFQGILGFSELLETDLDEMSHTEVRNIAGYLHDTAEAAYKLLDNLLQWAMVESGQMRFHPKPLMLETIFDLVEGSLGGTAHHKTIKLHFDCPHDLIVCADENMLRSVIRNLVANAVKFTSAGGQVSVNAVQQDDRIVITVQDTGVGMTDEQIHKLFRIESSNSTRGTSGEVGTGLGLMLCHQFVDRHQGQIHVESTIGQGSRFKISLPHPKLEDYAD
jgi:signal transduction histidine kinase